MTTEIQKYNGNTIENIELFKTTMDNIYSELSKKPRSSNIKPHPYIKKKVKGKYVPLETVEIGYVESQLDRLFLSWDWEIKSANHTVNGFVVYGDLTVLTLNGAKIKRSGIGGVEYKTSKDTGKLKLDLSNMVSGAMHTDPAAAEAYALKNAAAKLGNIFGRGLNRDFDHEHHPETNIMNNVFNLNNKEENE